MSYRLVVEKGRSKGKSIRLKANGIAVIGRESGNQLVITDPQTSRRHVQLLGRLGEFVLTDLSSSNGTFVNGEKVNGKFTLSPGDKIAVGDTLVYFLEETQNEDAKHRKGELSGREIAGYRIGRLLGRGGMGTVYEAVQISLERTVAFKTLAPELTTNPEFIERFISEARAAGRLSHANIVAVFDVDHEGDQHFYSMEYMPGGSVEDALRRDGPMTLERTIPIIFDAARGLEYAEKHGLIHRDIKPDNLMIGADEVVKICDLGLATFTSKQQEVSGSPHYIAPEQALGKDIDHRADLYALGVSWYQLLCGETPFTGSSPQEIARKHVEQEAPPLAERAPDVPPEVIALIARLMAKDPEGRLGSARQLQADLAELARRYPIRETVLLRIDAVAPNQPPSEALLEAVETPTVSPNLSWIALALVAVALLAAAFIVTTKVMGNKSRTLAQAVARVQDVRELLAAGRLDEVKTRGVELAARLEEAGLDEQAAAANALSVEAIARLDAAEAAETEKQARAKLDETAKLFREHGATRPADPSNRARLEEILRLLDGLIGEFKTTQAAKEAAALREEVSAALAEATEAKRRLAKRQAEARRNLHTTEKGIRALLEQRTLPRRFKLALERAEEYHKRFADVEPVGGQRLVELVREEATRAVRAQRAKALQHIAQGQWFEAEEALASVQPPIGFPDLDRRVGDVRRTLEDRRGASDRDQKARDEEADRGRLARSLSAIAATCAQRRYKDAASNLRSETPHLKTDHTRRLASVRIARLEGAARSVALLVAEVRRGEAVIELELEFTKVGRKTGRAVDVGVKGRRFTFEHSPFVKSRNLDQFTADELLGFFDAIKLSTRQRLDLACLAYELGAGLKASELVAAAGGLDPSLKPAIDDLIFLAREQ